MLFWLLNGPICVELAVLTPVKRVLVLTVVNPLCLEQTVLLVLQRRSFCTFVGIELYKKNSGALSTSGQTTDENLYRHCPLHRRTCCFCLLSSLLFIHLVLLVTICTILKPGPILRRQCCFVLFCLILFWREMDCRFEATIHFRAWIQRGFPEKNGVLVWDQLSGVSDLNIAPEEKEKCRTDPKKKASVFLWWDSGKWVC